MFKFLRTKQNEQLNKKSKIISTKFSILNTYELLTERDCLKYEMIVFCNNDKYYKIVTQTTEFSKIEVNVFDNENKKITNVQAFGEICNKNNQYYFILDRIGNGDLKKMGIAHLMMQSIISILSQYEKLYNIEFHHIEGTLGIYGNDTPEASIPFYKTFDKFNFNDIKTLHLQKEKLNINDRLIYYLIA